MLETSRDGLWLLKTVNLNSFFSSIVQYQHIKLRIWEQKNKFNLVMLFRNINHIKFYL